MRPTYRVWVSLRDSVGASRNVRVFDDVLFTEERGSMFCIHCENGAIYRYPIANIRLVAEEH